MRRWLSIAPMVSRIMQKSFSARMVFGITRCRNLVTIIVSLIFRQLSEPHNSKRARKNVEIRRELVRKYNEAFISISEIKPHRATPYEAADVYHAYHLYVIQVEDRLGLYNVSP